MKHYTMTLFFLATFVVLNSPPANADTSTDTAVDNQAPKLCGDGTCDEPERTSGKCPLDCGGTGPCGDGTCDEREQETGKCPVDCEDEE